jgi:uncharacterized protein (TIGR03000 family)
MRMESVEMRSSVHAVASGLAAFVVLALVAGDVQAGWHHRHGGSAGSAGGSSGGSDGGGYGSYGSAGGSHGSAGGSASDGGSHGGGHRHGWRARRHGSAGGSAGSAGGSTGGSYGSAGGSSGGSYGGSHGSAGGVPSFTPDQAAKVEVPKDGVILTVQVPAEARVFVNGKETSSLGTTRVFASKGLTAGKKYDFVVKMQTTRDGKPLEETKKVSLVAGDRQTVALAGEPADRPKTAFAAVSTPPAKQ